MNRTEINRLGVIGELIDKRLSKEERQEIAQEYKHIRTVFETLLLQGEYTKSDQSWSKLLQLILSPDVFSRAKSEGSWRNDDVAVETPLGLVTVDIATNAYDGKHAHDIHHAMIELFIKKEYLTEEDEDPDFNGVHEAFAFFKLYPWSSVEKHLDDNLAKELKELNNQLRVITQLLEEQHL